MTAPPANLPEPDERLALAWRMAQPTMNFILNVEQASRANEDIVDGLLFAAIQSANVATISNDPELQVAYAVLADAPPDELRRPVSVNAVAQSLRMPFETARRRVQRMVRRGALEVTAKGVRVSPWALGADRFLDNVILRHEHLRAFYLEVRSLGLVPPEPTSQRTWDSPPLRLTNRLIWEYMLRVADDLGALVGDTTNGVIMLAMIRENISSLPPEQLAVWMDDPPAVARPVRNRKLAERLKLSSETLRRYVIALEEDGFCQRGPRGLVAMVSPSTRAALDRMVVDNLANLQRLLTRLRQFGVLAEWDAAAVAAA
ncbi:hypothetical protein [Phenylobacterium sp.]|uniref:hypothetical protein n=1 Tax=Phenylobacterium sp. TaxID=1871053 RepID=UPI0025E6CD96|nr:hypothetical protein [Phenylobacterium sp.]